MQGPGGETNTEMNTLNLPSSGHPLGPEGDSFQHKAVANVVHGAGAVSASSSSASTRDDEKPMATSAAPGAGGLLVAASSSTENSNPPMEEDARIMIDFLQELTSPDRMSRGPALKKAAPGVHKQQQQQQGGDLPPVPEFAQPPQHAAIMNQQSPLPAATARAGAASIRDEAGPRLHAPAFLFPSSRQSGASPPPTTFRITIKDGVVQRHDNRPGQAEEQQERPDGGEAEARRPVVVESEARGEAPPATISAAMVGDEAGLYSNEASEFGNLTATEALAVEGGSGAYGGDMEGEDGPAQPRGPAMAQRGPSAPLVPVKRYPLPDVRPMHSATFRAPLGLTMEHPQHMRTDDFYPNHNAAGSSSSNVSGPRDRLSFSMPSRSDLSASNLSGQPYATERVWERRTDPARVRRPPHVHPPADLPPGGYRGASSSSRTGNSPIFFEVGSGRRGPPSSMGPASSSEWEDGNGSYTPTAHHHHHHQPHFFRKPAPGYGAPQQQQQQQQQRGSSSSSTYFSPNSSLDSFPSSTELSRSNTGGQQQQHRGPSQWDLFNELVNQAERAEKELERKEREAEREEYRKYNCGWHRVGYYRKCQETYGDPRLYDSEDEDYEDPHETGWATYTDGPVPPPRDFQRVRDRMLQIDGLIKAQPIGKPMPKFNSTQWKTVRRRDSLRRNGVKKERGVSSYAYLDGSDVHTPPRKKTPAEKVRNNGYYSNKAAKSYKTSPGAPSIRLPGQPPKRQSTALKDSYDIMPDGTIKCRRCGKMGFCNELALRSHLSHCPGTIKMKEARMAKEAALYAAMQQAAGSSGALSAADIAKVTREVNDAAANGTLPPFTPSSHDGAAMMMMEDGDDTKLPSHPPNLSYLGQQRSFDSSGRLSPPVMIVPVPDDGIPLVPGTIRGEDIIKKPVSFHNRLLHGWTDVMVLNYRTRRNSHLIQYQDGTTEWVVLTDHNTCLEPGYRGTHQAGGSSSEAGGAATHDQDPEASFSSKLGPSSSGSSGVQFQGAGRGGGASSSQSGDSSDDGQSGSKRRSTRFEGSGLGPSSSYNEAAAASSSSATGTNDFFKKQEELLTRRGNKRKAGDVSEGGSGLQDDQHSVSDMSDAGGPCKVVVRMEQSVDADGQMRKIMRVQPPQRPVHHHQHHHQHHHHHQPSMVQYTPPRPAKSPYTGMTVRNNYGPGGAPAPAATSFPCRRCLMLFHNKQALGWHTRKGCVGPIPSQGAPSLGPSLSQDMAYGASSSSLSKVASSSSSSLQASGSKRTYDDLAAEQGV